MTVASNSPPISPSPSFQEYVLVAQDRPHLTRYVRQADGQWLRSEVEGLEAVLQLVSVPCALALSDVYRFINFLPLEDYHGRRACTAEARRMASGNRT